jgi:hypothetical protein
VQALKQYALKRSAFALGLSSGSLYLSRLQNNAPFSCLFSPSRIAPPLHHPSATTTSCCACCLLYFALQQPLHLVYLPVVCSSGGDGVSYRVDGVSWLASFALLFVVACSVCFGFDFGLIIISWLAVTQLLSRSLSRQ